MRGVELGETRRMADDLTTLKTTTEHLVCRDIPICNRRWNSIRGILHGARRLKCLLDDSLSDDTSEISILHEIEPITVTKSLHFAGVLQYVNESKKSAVLLVVHCQSTSLNPEDHIG